MRQNLSKLLMRSAIAGVSLSTLFIAALYGGALMGSDWAMNMLLMLTLPGVNLLAVLLPDSESVMPFIAFAWLQISVVLSLLVASVAVFARRSASVSA